MKNSYLFQNILLILIFVNENVEMFNVLILLMHFW